MSANRHGQEGDNLRPPKRLGIPTRRADTVNRQRRGERQRQQTDPFNVLQDVLVRQGWKVFLRVQRLGDVVVGDVNVRGDVGGCDGFDFWRRAERGEKRRAS